MLAEKRVLALGDADRVLQFAANSQDGRHFPVKEHRDRHESSRAAKLARATTEDSHHRIVATQKDFAVVHQQAVGQLLQPFNGFPVADHDRFFAEIGARHHQRVEIRPVKQ